MEHIVCELDAAKFDQALHGGAADGLPVLAEHGDLAVYIKPAALVSGRAGAVITFTVQLPDGTRARVQATTTAALLELVGGCVRGWRDGGHIK